MNPSLPEPLRNTLNELYNVVMKAAIKEFNKEGELAPGIIVAKLGEDHKIEKVSTLPHDITHFFFKNGETKELFGQFIRGLLDPEPELVEKYERGEIKIPFFPNVIMHISEAWTVKVDNGDPMPDEAPSEHPNREECIICCVNIPHHAFIGMCPIEENPRRAKFQPLEFGMSADGGHVEGRLTSVDRDEAHTLH